MVTKTSPLANPFNEKELLALVSRGDEKAFRVLFDFYWQNIYGVAFAFTKSTYLAEEMVQDIFLKAWIKRERLAAVENFRSYLFILARNHILNVLRKKINEQPFTNSLLDHVRDTGSCPHELLAVKQSEELIKKAIGQLPQQQRTVFQLTRDKGLSHESVAGMLNISKHTVKSHMHKAIQFIRTYVERFSILITMLLYCR